MFTRILSRFSLELRYVRGNIGRDSRPSRVMSYRIVCQSQQVRKIQCREEREPRMMRSMDCSLIVLIHIGLITVNTMALAIVPSSHLTHIGWHGSTIVWWTLTIRSYKVVVWRISRLLIPAAIRSRTLSILRPIIGSISHRMRCPMRHSVSRNIRSGSNKMTSRSRDTTS